MRLRNIIIVVIVFLFVFGGFYFNSQNSQAKISANQSTLPINDDQDNMRIADNSDNNNVKSSPKISDNFYSAKVGDDKTIKNKIAQIPLEEKIAQMIVVSYDITAPYAIEDVKSAVKNNQVSGVMFYKRHITSKAGIKSKIDEFNKLSTSPYPLFMMIDQEGGRVSRIAKDNGFKLYPSAQYVAKYYTLNQAYNIYYEMASDLKNVGINFNLAPCVDVKTNPKSQIASDFRIYGSTPEKVFDYSNEFVKAHNKAKVIVALKHFPGLGNGVADSHFVVPDLTETWKKEELTPYKMLIEEYPYIPVLVGHALNRNLDKDNISSLSQKTISVLSKDMQHSGVVMADAVDMDGMKGTSIDDIIIKAINSGIDLFVFPNHVYTKTNSKKCMNPDLFIKIVKNAVSSGKIKQEKIDSSFEKIIDLKRRISD